MKLACTINGQPAELEIPDVAQVPRLGLTQIEAAKCIGIHPKTLGKLTAKGLVRRTVCGIYPVSGIVEFLESDPAIPKRTRKAIV